VRRRGLVLAAGASVAAFTLAFGLRLHAAYGPFHLSTSASDWRVLWELWQHGQIARDVVIEGALLGAGAGLVPWALLGLAARRRRPRP
jgi:hypothetical protein